AQPLVFKERELLDVVPAVHVLQGVELEALGLLEPERRAGIGAEVPADDVANLLIQLGFGVRNLLVERGTGDRRGLTWRVFHGRSRRVGEGGKDKIGGGVGGAKRGRGWRQRRN